MAAAFERAERVITVSEESRRLLEAQFGLPKGKGTVICNGRPTAFFEPPEPRRRA